MNELSPSRTFADLSSDKPICLAILAMGGQGGGVLADWIVAVAESSGWHAQSTSVPGVAQRTGATIYYVELLSGDRGLPVTLSLMPTPGDVDVVLAAELMEGGRSILRGLVTPERTVLITATHRALAIVEKSKPGDGAGDPNVVTRAAGVAAKRVIALDLQLMADEASSMISASMLGALAGCGALPFGRPNFEAAVAGGGRGANASLRAFAFGFDAAAISGAPAPIRSAPEKVLALPPTMPVHPLLDGLIARVRTEFPDEIQPMLMAGVKRLLDYQDPAYAADYLDRVWQFSDAIAPVAQAAAKYIAITMAYDDVIRVADLKTRATRFARVRKEMGVGPGQMIATTEFMHPRGQEVVGMMPATLGGFIEQRPRLLAAIDRLVSRPRRVRTSSIFWFLALYAVSALRPVRRGTWRHRQEVADMEQWLTLAAQTIPRNALLAAEILAARRLVKGYSDTHVRGAHKFARVLSAVPLLVDRADGADWMRRLREAALQDEQGTALEGVLQTIRTLDYDGQAIW